MCKKIKLLVIIGSLGITQIEAQTENSPYSRYGLGDQLPARNMLSRAIGGVSAAYADVFSINYVNPASYSKLKRSSFDFSVELDSRTLRVLEPPRKFNSVTPIISSIQLAFPLSQKRDWGMNIGLRPMTRINYKIAKDEDDPNLEGVQNVNTLFEGNGGSYEVYLGSGIGIKSLSVGFNVGFLFGTKDNSTSRSLNGDSTETIYQPVQYKTNTSFGGLFVNGGLQYGIKLGGTKVLRLGAYGSLKREISATEDETVFTFVPSSTTGLDTIDVVKRSSNRGKITYPANTGFGLMYNNGEKLRIGADFSKTSWSSYRYFGLSDEVQDAWTFHVGGQVVPNPINPKTYWQRTAYRLGFSFGQDYVKVDEDLPVWTVSVGFGFPMRPAYQQFSVINTTVEFGRRGKSEGVITENFLRIGVGLTLSDLWFLKPKYD